MLDTNLDTTVAPASTPTSAATAMTIGEGLRRNVAENPARTAITTQRVGELDVQLVRWENKWTLYLADLTPIPHSTRDLWATAVSAPSVEWSQTPDGCSTWCAWTEVQP